MKAKVVRFLHPVIEGFKPIVVKFKQLGKMLTDFRRQIGQEERNRDIYRIYENKSSLLLGLFSPQRNVDFRAQIFYRKKMKAILKEL